MNTGFENLREDEKRMLRDVLSRRTPALFARIASTDRLSPSDAEIIVVALSDEFTDNLDDRWEPTAYGTVISDLLQRVNEARLDQT